MEIRLIKDYQIAKILMAVSILANLIVIPHVSRAETQNIDDVIPKSWLIKKVNVEQVEQENLVSNEKLGPKAIPFGFINKQWNEFKSKMKSGDELWEFRSPSETWAKLAGRQGFCVIRDGKIIYSITTLMN